MSREAPETYFEAGLLSELLLTHIVDFNQADAIWAASRLTSTPPRLATRYSVSKVVARKPGTRRLLQEGKIAGFPPSSCQRQPFPCIFSGNRSLRFSCSSGRTKWQSTRSASVRVRGSWYGRDRREFKLRQLSNQKPKVGGLRPTLVST
jgi:hypothetical protein